MLVATRQWIACDPGIYTIHLFTSERSRLVCEPPRHTSPKLIYEAPVYSEYHDGVQLTEISNSSVILHDGLYKMTFS